jgi:hypothetical protein
MPSTHATATAHRTGTNRSAADRCREKSEVGWGLRWKHWWRAWRGGTRLAIVRIAVVEMLLMITGI